jgi:hypothetical protein
MGESNFWLLPAAVPPAAGASEVRLVSCVQFSQTFAASPHGGQHSRKK